jgi:uncharacterized protein YcgL (UPF0745 family)
MIWERRVTGHVLVTNINTVWLRKTNIFLLRSLIKITQDYILDICKNKLSSYYVHFSEVSQIFIESLEIWQKRMTAMLSLSRRKTLHHHLYHLVHTNKWIQGWTLQVVLPTKDLIQCRHQEWMLVMVTWCPGVIYYIILFQVYPYCALITMGRLTFIFLPSFFQVY